MNSGAPASGTASLRTPFRSRTGAPASGTATFLKPLPHNGSQILEDKIMRRQNHAWLRGSPSGNLPTKPRHRSAGLRHGVVAKPVPPHLFRSPSASPSEIIRLAMEAHNKREHLRHLVQGKSQWSRSLTPKEKALGFLGWHERGYLPHCDFPNLIQLVTFRLADSLPQSRISEWRHLLEIEDHREKRARLEAYLDRGYGACHLRMERVARLVEQKAIDYTENNPVKTTLCPEPKAWPFSSARFRDEYHRLILPI